MTNQLLPDLQPNRSESPFFPSFQKEMNRLLDQFRTGFPVPDTTSAASVSGPMFPAIDVVETEDAVEISAEVPGVKEDDLSATITGDMLTLKGEKSAEHEKKEDNYHLIERRYGSFRRQIRLGFTPDDGAVKTDFSDGVLKLHIAKPAIAKSEVKKIDIKKS